MNHFFAIRRVIPLAALIAAAAIWGCGGGGSSNNNTGGGGAAATADDFILTSSPAGSLQVAAEPGSTKDVPLILRSVNGFKAPVTLSTTAVPAGWSVTFTPNNIPLNAGDTNVTMKITLPAGAAGGSSGKVVYKAVGGGLLRFNATGPYYSPQSSAVTVNLVGASIATPSSLTLPVSAGGFAPSIDLATGVGVSITAAGAANAVTPTVNGLPAGVSATFSSPTITLPTNGNTVRVDFLLVNTSAVAAGTYPISVSFTNAGKTVTSPPINLVVSADPSVGNLLVVSGSTANTTDLHNGPLTGLINATKFLDTINYGGTDYHGEYSATLSRTNVVLLTDLLGLPLNDNTPFSVATGPAIVTYTEAGKTWRATTGVVTAVRVTDKLLRVSYQDVHFVPSGPGTGGSDPTGEFTLNGVVSYPVTEPQ